MLERQLRADVERLAVAGGRLPGSPGHQAARDMISERMASLGLRPYADAAYELAYQAGALHGRNLIGVAPGRSGDLPPILVAAHYDTCGPFPGADDNAAAVAGLVRYGFVDEAHRLLTAQVEAAEAAAEAAQATVAEEVAEIDELLTADAEEDGAVSASTGATVAETDADAHEGPAADAGEAGDASETAEEDAGDADA